MSNMTTGLVLGSFAPPHIGDVHVFEFAKNFVDQLRICVIHRDNDVIPIATRLSWLHQLSPGSQLVQIHVSDDADPVTVSRHIVERMQAQGAPVECVFGAGEPQRAIARSLNARFIPIGQQYARTEAESAIADDPSKHWHLIPRIVRPNFVRRVCIFGPESTGKTTLAQNLAEHFSTVAALEWARLALDEQANELLETDLPLFARGQVASEDALAFEANRVLFCDTDPLITAIWSKWLYDGRCHQDVLDLANSRKYDLYLLTDIDVPWVADPQRYLPLEREKFFDCCLTELKQRNRQFAHIKGAWPRRLEAAVEAVEQLFSQPKITQQSLDKRSELHYL